MRCLFIFLSFFLIPFLAQSKLVEVNDTQLNVINTGRGLPLVVIHGGPGLSHNYLRPHLDPLGIRSKVFFYDQRCCGLSSGAVSAEQLTVDQSIEDVEGLRKKLGLERIVILGHAWGGFVAMRYAAKYPDRVAALILIDTFPASTDGLELVVKNFAERMAINKKVLDQIRSSTPFAQANPNTMEIYYRMMYSPMLHYPGNIKKIDFSFTVQGAQNANKVHELLAGDLMHNSFDLHSLLANIKAPTLLIHGEEDFIPTSTAKRIQQAIPNAQYIEIADVGHFPFAEKQDETLETITKFLTNLELVRSR